jgi:hypothetical protein
MISSGVGVGGGGVSVGAGVGVAVGVLVGVGVGVAVAVAVGGDVRVGKIVACGAALVGGRGVRRAAMASAMARTAVIAAARAARERRSERMGCAYSTGVGIGVTFETKETYPSFQKPGCL